MMFLRRSSIASQPASNEQFSIMGLPWVTSSDLSSRVMGFRVHIEMSNENGRVKLNFQPCVRSGVGFDPWRGFLDVERKSFNPPGQESDVSIYGERQTLLRFCFRGSHLSSFFLPPNHLRHLIFAGPSATRWFHVMMVVMCVFGPNQHTKSAHRDRAITSFWSKEPARHKTEKPSLNRENLFVFLIVGAFSRIHQDY